MGVEALAEHANDPGIDRIVLDTAPAARGVDFLKAPQRMGMVVRVALQVKSG